MPVRAIKVAIAALAAIICLSGADICFMGQQPDPRRPDLGLRWVLPYTKDIVCKCTKILFGGMNLDPFPGSENFFYPEDNPLSLVNNDDVEYLQEKLGCKEASWGDWSACSFTCGDGSRTRMRICEGSDTNEGIFCDGAAPLISESCNEGPCATWGDWGDWSACSSTCGNGSRTRMRICEGSDTNEGILCDGDAPSKSESCNDGPCATWGDWGDWSACSSTCGDGSRTRMRTCEGSDTNEGIFCNGDAPSKLESCNDRPCATWGDWGDWSVCSSTCGDGSRTRMRNCEGSDTNESILCDGDAPSTLVSYNDGPCVCHDSLGMDNGDIPDANIQASSVFSYTHKGTEYVYRPEYGRLNNNDLCWGAAEDDIKRWIQADIGYETHVSGVITQGDGGVGKYEDWVTLLKVSTFLDATGAEEFVLNHAGIEILQGNSDINTEMTNMFLQPVLARIVRITCIDKNGDYYQLRFEILGCKKN